MADLCVCGHEEREHYYVLAVGALYPMPCPCYRRSPLSAFRGPAVGMSREEAAGWLDGIGMESTAHDVLVCGERAIRDLARWNLHDARYYRAHGNARGAAECYLAARILRAMRP